MANVGKHLSSLVEFCGVRVAHSLLFCVVFCGSVFALFLMLIDIRLLIILFHKIPRVNSGASEGKQYKAVSTKLHWRKLN
jgi:hypothetical protein